MIRLTECELPISNSPAVEHLNALTTRAFQAAGKSFSPDGRHIGIVPMLGRLLREAGCQHIQQMAHALDVSAGPENEEAHQGFAQDYLLSFQLGRAFLLQYSGASEEEYDRLYQQVPVELLSDDFCAIEFFLLVWAKSRSRSSQGVTPWERRADWRASEEQNSYGKKPHIMIAEPREALRKGLCAIFAQGSGGAQVTEVATSEELKEQLEHQAFDLVVVHQVLVTDLTILPRGNFIILATEPDVDMLFAARLHGARAYLLDTVSAALLRQTLQLARGTFLTDPAVSAWIAEYLAHHLLLSISDEVLTAREQDIFHLLWSGLSNREMARQLGLSEATIKTHVKHIYTKLRLNRRQVKILALVSKGGWQA